MTLRKRRSGLVYPTNEDWHYVGDTGEPDWYDPGSGDAWQNNSAPDKNLAFRVRETGIVDIHGFIRAVATPTTDNRIFDLPVAYRPSADTYYPATGLTTASKYVAVMVSISASSGAVSVLDAYISPFPGAANALETVSIAIQMFLTPASAP